MNRDTGFIEKALVSSICVYANRFMEPEDVMPYFELESLGIGSEYRSSLVNIVGAMCDRDMRRGEKQISQLRKELRELITVGDFTNYLVMYLATLPEHPLRPVRASDREVDRAA